MELIAIFLPPLRAHITRRLTFGVVNYRQPALTRQNGLCPRFQLAARLDEPNVMARPAAAHHGSAQSEHRAARPWVMIAVGHGRSSVVDPHGLV